MKLNSLFPLMALCLLAACNTTPLGADGSPAPLPLQELIGQTQLPPGSRVVHEQSLILGAGDNWVGRLALDVGRDTSAAYNFFLDQYQRNGWGLISASRGKSSLLVFTKADRSAAIEISEGGALSGPNLVMTITPRSANTPPVARPAAAPMPATTAVPTPVRP
jgi:hypothetical protein